MDLQLYEKRDWHRCFPVKFVKFSWTPSSQSTSGRLLLWLIKYEILIARNSHQRCSRKKGVLKNFTKLTGKHLCQNLFFNKVSGVSLQHSGTGVFLWILQKFYEHLFYRTPPDDCFPIVNALPIYSLIFTSPFSITYWFKK